MKTVRNFALYGSTEAQPAWADLVHFERIPDRSSLYAWEIDLHFHDALIQVLHSDAADAARHSSTRPDGRCSRLV